ncbi:hypothetical protein EDD17DRAFT_1659932 [Pisolithus thermaeus]|nr:hypothetical protein EDD17DRAFT_1659932 [Pisolithus thermaeus]
METDPPSDILSLGDREGDGSPVRPTKLPCPNKVMRRNLFKSNLQSDTARSDPRLETALPLLRRRYQAFLARYDAPDKQEVECELESISQNLGVDLLHHIMITFDNVCCERNHGKCPQASDLYYDSQPNAPSIVQEIRALQVKFNATEDEDERRALEEDVTGKARTVLIVMF